MTIAGIRSLNRLSLKSDFQGASEQEYRLCRQILFDFISDDVTGSSTFNDRSAGLNDPKVCKVGVSAGCLRSLVALEFSPCIVKLNQLVSWSRSPVLASSSGFSLGSSSESERWNEWWPIVLSQLLRFLDGVDEHIGLLAGASVPQLRLTLIQLSSRRLLLSEFMADVDAVHFILSQLQAGSDSKTFAEALALFESASCNPALRCSFVDGCYRKLIRFMHCQVSSQLRSLKAPSVPWQAFLPDYLYKSVDFTLLHSLYPLLNSGGDKDQKQQQKSSNNLDHVYGRVEVLRHYRKFADGVHRQVYSESLKHVVDHVLQDLWNACLWLDGSEMQFGFLQEVYSYSSHSASSVDDSEYCSFTSRAEYFTISWRRLVQLETKDFHLDFNSDEIGSDACRNIIDGYLLLPDILQMYIEVFRLITTLKQCLHLVASTMAPSIKRLSILSFLHCLEFYFQSIVISCELSKFHIHLLGLAEKDDLTLDKVKHRHGVLIKNIHSKLFLLKSPSLFGNETTVTWNPIINSIRKILSNILVGSVDISEFEVDVGRLKTCLGGQSSVVVNEQIEYLKACI